MRQIKALVHMGLARHIDVSNMTIPKIEAVLGKLCIPPPACESELHPCFQQQELFDCLVKNDSALYANIILQKGVVK